jgi:protein phosphatase
MLPDMFRSRRARATPALTLRFAVRSDRGLMRSGNQDSVYAGPRLLAVADGMGGMAGGDLASGLIVRSIKALDRLELAGARRPAVPALDGDLIGTLQEAVARANDEIRQAVQADPALSGMGSTLTAMLFADSRVGLVHVGDSRAYLLRDARFRQLTKDDTYIQMLLDNGTISAEEAAGHPQRSVVTRVLQGRPVDPTFSVSAVKAGDRYLICSDGLSNVVGADSIEATLRERTEPDDCAEHLLRLVLREGAPDNVTVVVADVVAQPVRRLGYFRRGSRT